MYTRLKHTCIELLANSNISVFPLLPLQFQIRASYTLCLRVLFEIENKNIHFLA